MRLKRVHYAKRCLSPALNADSIPRKKFFVFLVASAIEASSRRKTVSFTSSIPLESDKKNAHGQRRAISVRGTSFHSETGLGLWLKRKPFPHLRTEARSKRKEASPAWNQERADWSDCETGLGQRKPFPHLQSEARSKRTTAGECWLKPGECRADWSDCETGLGLRLKRKAILTSAIGSTEQTFSSECQTGNDPLESAKKNAHGQRRAINVRGTSFHSETGLGLWLKRNSRICEPKHGANKTGECRLKPGEGRLKRLRDRPRSEKAIPASAIRSTEQTKPGECWLKPGECRLKRLRDRPRSSAKEKAIPTSAIGSTEQTFSSEFQTGNVPSCSVVTKAARTGCTPKKGHSLNDKALVEKEGQNGGFSKALNWAFGCRTTEFLLLSSNACFGGHFLRVW